MRITGGEARGRQIACPDGLALRPTGSKMRQAFFNILANKLNEASFLDLCAGSGLMGLEALSRGAASLIAVEEDRKVARAIEANLKLLGYDGEVICGDVRKVLPVLAGSEFEIIFADPPYKSALAPCILELIEKHSLLRKNGSCVIEHLKNIEMPEQVGLMKRISHRNYGQSSFSFYELSA